jgi:hypothetical protein
MHESKLIFLFRKLLVLRFILPREGEPMCLSCILAVTLHVLGSYLVSPWKERIKATCLVMPLMCPGTAGESVRSKFDATHTSTTHRPTDSYLFYSSLQSLELRGMTQIKRNRILVARIYLAGVVAIGLPLVPQFVERTKDKSLVVRLPLRQMVVASRLEWM